MTDSFTSYPEAEGEESALDSIALLQPVQVHKLYLTAANQIAEAIGRGAWSPGDKLPSERELARMLDVSRSTLRQAFAALEALSVIRIKAGVGAFVQEGALDVIADELVSELVTEGDPMMLVEARLSIEPSIAALAAENHTKADLPPMERALELMSQAQEGEAAADFIQADIRFHMLIALATKNTILARLFEQIVDQMHHRVWTKAALPVVAKRAAAYQEDHLQIFQAIRKRNGAEARRHMDGHLRGIRANLESFSSIASE